MRELFRRSLNCPGEEICIVFDIVARRSLIEVRNVVLGCSSCDVESEYLLPRRVWTRRQAGCRRRVGDHILTGTTKCNPTIRIKFLKSLLSSGLYHFQLHI